MEKSIRLSDHFSYSKLLRFTLPSIVMMVFTSIYGVVDGLFVSNFVGKTAFASVNLVMPFVMILGGMGFMLGTGGTALVSKILGEGDPDSANRTFSMMVLFTLALGAVLSAAGIVFMRPVSRFLGPPTHDGRLRAVRPHRHGLYVRLHAAKTCSRAFSSRRKSPSWV